MATTAQSIRSFLDSLSQLPGSVLYRSPLNWKGLPPGDAGQYLALDDARMPAWKTLNDFQPALQQYDAATTFYKLATLPLLNGPWTIPFRFRGVFNNTAPRIWNADANGLQYNDCFMNATGHLFIRAQNTAGAFILQIRTKDPFDDNQLHYGWIQFNPATAAVQFIIDGEDQDDLTYGPRIAIPGTMRADTTGELWVGNFKTTARNWDGQIGAFGWKNTDLLNWQDFMSTDGWPLPIDHTTWAQFIAQPPVWHESGYLQSNRGNAGPFTVNGPLTLADPLTWK